MPNALEKLAFETAQAARIGWFTGQKMLAARFAKPVAVPDHLRGRKTPDRQRLLSDMWELIEQDWRNIAAGIYAAPEGESAPSLAGLRRAIDVAIDAEAVEARRHGPAVEALLPDVPADRYPGYYRRKFHFQTDGYLSAASAERYDYQVELLFGGAAGAMRRQALVPLRAALRQQPERGARVRLLDVGCGTGALLREIKRNYPRLTVTGLDLSAPYLAVARRRLADWSRVTLAEGAAEAMPFAAGEFDVVTSVYLFHELPPRTRRAVLAEIRRVLKPGGTLIILDSLQTGDNPDYDALLDYFPLAFHEPYYASYLTENFGQVLRSDFIPQERSLAYLSKVTTYRRGGPPPASH